MYVRPPNYRYPPSVRVPENYSGNIFREQPQSSVNEPEAEVVESKIEQENVSAETIQEANTQKENSEPAEQASLLSPHGFRLRLGSIFGKGRGIGTEELLILSLILLLADSDEGFDDLILFLALLFFIK